MDPEDIPTFEELSLEEADRLYTGTINMDGLPATNAARGVDGTVYGYTTYPNNTQFFPETVTASSNGHPLKDDLLMACDILEQAGAESVLLSAIRELAYAPYKKPFIGPQLTLREQLDNLSRRVAEANEARMLEDVSYRDRVYRVYDQPLFSRDVSRMFTTP